MKKAKKLLFIIFSIVIIVSAFNLPTMAHTKEETTNYRIVDADDIGVASEHDIGYNFTDFQRAMYNELKAFITSVANGETSSTILQVRVDIASFDWEKDTVYDNMMALIDDVDVWQALVASCPYEFFWRGWVVGCSWVDADLSSDKFFDVTFSMLVSEEYRGANEYTVSAEAVASGKAAASTAKEIVAKYEGKSDLEKLQGYIDEIAALATYGRQGDFGPHDNLVYVFDGNLNTTVACEGYAKAYKYLCDLSTFDKDIYCHIVFGEDHMWNVVEIDGNNFLLDAAWYDTVDGQPYTEYFLAGGVSSNGGQTMTIKSHTGRTDTRSYDASERDRHCAGYLILSETGYHEHKYSDTWVSDDTHHWHECSCGDKIDLVAHTPDKNISISCTQGTVCTICAAEYGEPLPHTYDQQNLHYIKSPATCTESEEYYYSCECGAKSADTFHHGNPAGHSYNSDGICASCGDVIVIDKPIETPGADEDTDTDSKPDHSTGAPSDGSNDAGGKGISLILRLIKLLIEFIKFLFT